MKTINFKSVGVKSNYLGYQAEGLRGTVYFPKGFFVNAPDEIAIEAPFVDPKAPALDVKALQAELEALRAQVAAAQVA